jgi:hypothetical protein
MVVDEQSEADQPGRPEIGRMGQHETEGPDDVRGGVQQHLAFGQRLADQPELVIFQIAQAPVYQLGRGRRRGAAEVPLLAQEHRQPAARRIARDAAAIDATADHGKVVGRLRTVGH